jgi:hypothetical protein
MSQCDWCLFLGQCWGEVGQSHCLLHGEYIYVQEKKTTIHMEIMALEGGEACGDTQFTN